MSNNFDGPVILDSLALNEGYLGTGGRAGNQSVGPRVSGGVPVDPNGLLTAPQGSLHAGAATLWQNTDGATTWIPVGGGGGGGVAPITGLTFVDATYSGATPPDGSIGAPHTTIQDALTAIGDATTVAEQFQGWKVVISAGFYDEDLVIPQRRNIALDCAPGVILADAFPPTTSAKKITWAQNLASLGVVESYGLQINNLIMVDGIELVSGGASVDPSLELRLNQVSFIALGVGTIASIDATALTVGSGIVEVRDCLLRDTANPPSGFCFNAGGNAAYLSYANSCEFESSISALGYGQMVNSTFSGDQTYTDQSSVGNLDRPEGFFGCQFDAGTPNTFTMTVAGNFEMDGVTWRSCSNTTFVGATIRSLDDEYVAGNTPAANGAWAAGGDNTLSNAINRMANLLQTLNGGTAIP
jgi:hypothetical protein